MSNVTQLKPRQTRRPTGMPPWPILLIAGGEKSGKTWACAAASGSTLVGRTLWIGFGEDDPDEYGPNPATGEGGVPGADFEIVPHDGTWRDLIAAIEWCSAQTSEGGKPVLLVVDSMTQVWETLCGIAQDEANAQANKRGGDTVDADITMNLWNRAKDRWNHIVTALRNHPGPVLLTSRLEEVTVVENGRPTTRKQMKVRTEKNLPYDVGAIVEMPERGSAFLTGVRSTRLNLPHRIPMPGFTVDDLWQKLGLADGVGAREHSAADRSNVDPTVTQRNLLLGEIKTAVGNNNERLREIAAEWARAHRDEAIAETKDIGGLQLLRDDLLAAASRAAS